ncbi:unnamed protein product [Ambrosiozyma monospora]|uniref:Unnamed protein product n=1 Tax=Ambrosiozyma monospora TaxID=43982 RepID=A0ACB5U0G1_AMBMO|nr:unnamed protein product [Ambrosiozyma monospora]
MVNEKTGGVMHVDFDCLFDKGKKLAVPERVPFRLTRNMIAAMGVTGIEGVFRRTSEVTMELIRGNENILMNVLETFLYDPIMDWKANKGRSLRRHANEDELNMQPRVVMDSIRRKIKGILDPKDLDTGSKDSGGLSVSTGFQVDAAVLTACDDHNLAKMYIGWMPFL